MFKKILLVVVVLIVVGVIFGRKRPEDTREKPSAPSSASVAKTKQAVPPLAPGTFSKPDGSVLVADSEDHAERAFRFAAQKETVAISEGISKGALWWLSAKTRVKVIARDGDYAKAEVVDGPTAGKTCFVSEAFLENVTK